MFKRTRTPLAPDFPERVVTLGAIATIIGSFFIF
jgi:hypothetical protein